MEDNTEPSIKVGADADKALLPILWQDDDIVVVHKPAGWLVHRTGLDAGETRFVLQTLRDQLGRHVYPVHRLDKGTSGVLLMALHSDAARIVSTAFEAQQVSKRYIAMVRGWPPLPQWDESHALKPDDAHADALSQPASTSFRRLATVELQVPVDRYPTTRAALVEAVPHTGRRHQIRRHLKHISHPIIGDATHGKGPHNRWWATHLGLRRLWLHALSLRIRHPATGEDMCFHSPLDTSALAEPLASVLSCHGHAASINALTTQHEAVLCANDDWQAMLSRLPWRV